MWRRKSIVLVGAFLLGIAVVALDSDRASGQGDVHVLLPEGEGRGSTIDVVGGPGLTIGDGVAWRGPLVDAQSGEPAGSVYFECTVMRRIGLEEGLWRCSYHLRLAEGVIVLQGLDPRGMGASTFAAVGGTKAFRGAAGDAVFTDSAAGTDIVVTLT